MVACGLGGPGESPGSPQTEIESIYLHTYTLTQTQRHGDTQTHIDTHRHTDTHTDTCTEIHRSKDLQIYRSTDIRHRAVRHSWRVRGVFPSSEAVPVVSFKGPRPPISQPFPGLVGITRHYSAYPEPLKTLYFWRPFLRSPFSRFLAPKMPNLSPKGPPKPPKWSPKGSPKLNFLGIRAEVKIELPSRRELNSQGTRVSKAGPKELPKSEQPLREVPELTFEPLGRSLARFGRFWVALGTPLGGFLEVTFRAVFDRNSQI